VYRVVIYNRSMTQSEDTRRRVERKLGHRLPGATWENLEELGYVADFGVDKPGPIEDLVGLARNQERFFRKRLREKDRESSRSVHVEEPDYRPHIRATILSEVAADDAAKDPEVIGFRDEVLGGKLMSAEEAAQWMRHHTVVPPEDGGKQKHLGNGEITLLRLEELAHHLNGVYSWSVESAVTFILTGYPPMMPPIENRLVTRSILQREDASIRLTRVVLNIDPFEKPTRVAEYYSQIRKTLLGKLPRKQSLRDMRLAAFTYGECPGMSWEQKRRAWNVVARENGWKPASDDRRNFRRDALAAQGRLFSIIEEPTDRKGFNGEPEGNDVWT
jgi:hypothetical protein